LRLREKDIADEIANEAKNFGMSGEAWLKLISSKRDMSIDRIKNDYVWNKLALRRLVADSIRVTPQELQERMEFEFGAKVQVRQIVLNTQQQALEILASAKADPENFERLAKQHSIDPNSKAIGGLLPPVRRYSGLPEFEQVAFALQPGQISDVVPIADKFIVLKCERIFPAEQLPPDQLAAVHERLTEQISNQKLSDAAMSLAMQMQQNAQIQNVMNDENLSRQNPGVAATVNGVKVLKNQVAEECIVRFGRDMLETEINRTLLRQELQKYGIQVTQEDIDEEIARAATSIGHLNQDGSVDIDRWLAFVTGNDLSKVEFYIQDEVWPSVATKKLVENNVQVTQEDMKKGFEANFGPRVEVLVIVANDHRQALKVWNMATANPTAEYFGQLAHQYSIEPASKNNLDKCPRSNVMVVGKNLKRSLCTATRRNLESGSGRRALGDHVLPGNDRASRHRL
jgi:parvulin-like peptidyl-prolyl isomerase